MLLGGLGYRLLSVSKNDLILQFFFFFRDILNPNYQEKCLLSLDKKIKTISEIDRFLKDEHS